MAKKVVAEIKLQIPAGAANPSPPVGPALGQRGVNIMEFCKAFNAQTQAQAGLIIPVVITVYADRSFTFITEDAAGVGAAEAAAGLEKGSKEPGKTKVGTVTRAQVEEIARTKMPDLTAADVEAAMRTVEGTARSLGIDVGVSGNHGEARQAISERRQRRSTATRRYPMDEAVRTLLGSGRRGQVRRDRSRSRSGSASIRGRPTRTCAARWCCRTAPARPSRVLVFAKGEKARRPQEAGRRPRRRRRHREEDPGRAVARVRHRHRHARHDGAGRDGSERSSARAA